MKEQLMKVKMMLSPDYDWGKHWEDDDGTADSLDELARELFIPLTMGDEAEAFFKTNKSFACGSVEPNDTPKGLYRLLFITRPKTVPFDDMYKSTLFFVRSPDNRFSASAELFKYELGLYFNAPKDCVAGPGSGVQGGWPGCDNGRQCSDEIGSLWFEVLLLLANTELDVYDGNDFKV